MNYSKEEKTTIHQFLKNCTVPLIITDGQRKGILGTGAFFDFGSKFCFVTARHVLLDREKEFDSIGVPISPQPLPTSLAIIQNMKSFFDLPIWTFQKAVIYLPEKEKDDVAIIEIQDEKLIKEIKKHWRILSFENFMSPFSPPEECYIAGFPNSIAKNFDTRQIFPLFILRSCYIPVPTNKNIRRSTPFDARTDICFKYSDQLWDCQQEMYMETPALEGISGCLVWAKVPNESLIWNVENQLKICAIEDSFIHKYCIQAKKLNILEGIFQKMAPDIAEKMGEIIRK